ncbi:MAG: hypothetical protein NC402_01310 [Prevotella sp.]|nr:hypothetical protein [Prevotella sp.]MCM1074501.1 hypothetical protein [Ruminococcus sp.]
MKKILLTALLAAAGAGMASAQSFETYLAFSEEDANAGNYELVTNGNTYKAAYAVDGEEISLTIYPKFTNKTNQEMYMSMNVKPIKSVSNAADLGISDPDFSTCIFGNCPTPEFKNGVYHYETFPGNYIPANGTSPGRFGEHSGFHVFFDNAADIEKFSMDYVWEYIIEAAGETQTFTVLFQTPNVAGVEGIAADNTEAEYFNLQGLRVATPDAGQLYIKRQGGKASKVVF